MTHSPPLDLPSRIVRAVVATFLLAPLAGMIALFAFGPTPNAILVDAALSAGLGAPVEGTIRYEGCAWYREGDYVGSRNIDTGTRCSMVIEAAGERIVRPIDVDDPEALGTVQQPGRVFGTLGAAMPSAILFDRLGPFAFMLFFSVLLAGMQVLAPWSRPLRAEPRASGNAPR